MKDLPDIFDEILIHVQALSRVECDSEIFREIQVVSTIFNLTMSVKMKYGKKPFETKCFLNYYFLTES